MGRNSGWHRGLGRALVVCALAGGTVTALTPLAAQAGTGGTEYVATTGTDSGTCRLASHPCQTIGYALTQNTTDSTIMVAAGDYPEQLTITAPVTIDGAGASTVIDPSAVAANDTDPNHTTTPYPIVDVNGTNKVKLENLTVDGSAAVNHYNSCTQNPMGIYYHNASGSMA